MRFFDHSFLLRIPSFDGIIEACSDLWPPTAEPGCIPADSPIPIKLNDSAKLPIRGIGRRVVLLQWSYRNRRSTELMAFFVLVRPKLGFAQAALQFWKQMRDGLGIIPDMGGGSIAGSLCLSAALPSPQAAIGLPKNRGGLQNRKIRRDRLRDLGRRSRS